MNGQLSHRFGDIEDTRKNWGLFLTLGIILVLLGIGVMSSAFYATLFSVFLFGAFLLVGGIIQIFHGFMARKWSGLFLSLLLGILYIIAGVFSMFNPAMAAITLTLWIAVFCFVVGLFRMLTALFVRFDHWGWVFFNGLVTFILGAMIYSEWPLSGLWVIGLFVGIDMVLAGWFWIILSLTARVKA